MEFCNRYYEFCKGNKEQLQTAGQLIALILVVWAASFGVNEYGVEELYDNQGNPRRRRDRINEMVQEVLFLIDIHGILRKPTWDGVRALLLILPLTQGACQFWGPWRLVLTRYYKTYNLPWNAWSAHAGSHRTTFVANQAFPGYVRGYN